MPTRRHHNSRPFPCGRFSRRNFLQIAGAAAGGAALAGCRPLTPAPSPTPASTSPIETPARVAIARSETYDPALVRAQTETLFDSLGGIGDVIRPGDKVVVKVNLVGGANGGFPPPGTTAPESYVTHPAVARAMCELLRDAGAKDITVADSVWAQSDFEAWGYPAMLAGTGAALINLNRTDPYGDYAVVPVGEGWLIYESFRFNRLIEEADVLISVTKMKCHQLLGVTQSMKNLIGLAPYKFYELKAGDGYRTGFHGKESETATRLPRVVMDLNRARPVNLSLIDGIKTVEGSEGPWNGNLRAKSPGILIGGKNPVATDSVAVAAMGFDPAAEYPNPPFLRAENHLNLARALGLGTNLLEEIEILGAALDEVTLEFQPAW
ncbi:MAG: DUF362 domain-containing protein [Anaerolineales bacterium]|nr:DUF362 domain-containing protein [Anaerolineales bacterium]